MSVKVNLQAMPSHLLDGGLQRETIRIGRSSSQFKMPPWDITPIGEAVMLQLSYYRNPRVLLSEKALRLTYRHARQNNKSQFTCFLLGTLVVDKDEQAVTLTLDRLDPGREKPGSGQKVPNASLPGDVVVTCSFEARPLSFSSKTVAAHYAEDLSTSFKILKQSCTGKETMEVSQLLKLRCWFSCMENTDSLSFRLHWAGITLATILKASPIKAIPIIPTALARNLSSLCSLTQTISTVSQKRGYLTMDQTGKLLLILESDPKVYTLPLVGVWLGGVTHIHSPQVWAWSLRFLYSSSFQESALSEEGGFLVLLYSLTHRQPEFYMVQPTNSDCRDLDCQLLTSEESLTLYKNVEPNERKLFLFELSAGSQNQESELYKELMSHSASNRYVTGAPVAATPKSKLSISDHDSGLEDEDLSPRPSPNPHPAGEQVRQVQPTVPELSLVMDGSFVAQTTKPPDGTQACLLPTLQHREPVGSPRPHSGLNICGENRFGPSPPISRTVTPTVSSKGHEGTADRLSSPLLSSPPKTGMLPNASFEVSGHHPVGGFALESTPHAPHLSEHPQSPQSGLSGSISAQPVPNLCMAPSPSLKSVNSCCHCHHTEFSPSYHPQPWPETPLPLGLSHQITPPKAAAYPYRPKSTPPRDCCLSPSHQATCAGPVCVMNTTNSAAVPQAPKVTPPRACCLSSPHQTPGPVCMTRTPPSHRGNLQYSSLTNTHQSCPVPPVSHMQGFEGSPFMDVPDTCLNTQMNMLPVDAYKLLKDQDRQLKLLQAQINKLLEAQNQRACFSQPQAGEKPVKLTTNQAQTSPNPKKRNHVSIAIGTGASLFCGRGEVEEWWRDGSAKTLSNSSSQSQPSSPTARSQTHNTRIKDIEEERRNDEQDYRASQEMRPCGSDSVESIMLGESVSMCYQRQITNTDESKSVTDDQKFFQDLLGQVNSRLQETSTPYREMACKASSSSSQSATPPSHTSSQSQPLRHREKVYNSTVKQLEKLGVNMAPKEKASANVTVESASTLAHINPEAVISKLGVCDLTSGSMWAPGCTADLSLEANSIALKYLSDTQLSAFSLSKAPKNFLSESLVERTAAGLSMFSPTNMSLATQKYMKRYGLIEGGDYDEEVDEDQQEQRNSTHHGSVSHYSSVSDLSVQVESSGNNDGVQRVLKNITNTLPFPPSPYISPNTENKDQIFRDIRSTVQGLLHSHDHPEKKGPKGRAAQKLPSAPENQPPLGSVDSQGSVGNFLDLSRLRQLPKLF